MVDGPVLAPVCPLCGELPQLVISPVQAFCGNDACKALMWDMTQDPVLQVRDMQPVRLLRDDLG